LKSIFLNHLKNVLIASARTAAENHQCTGTTLETKPTSQGRPGCAQDQTFRFDVGKLLFIFLVRNYCTTDQCPKTSIVISLF